MATWTLLLSGWVSPEGISGGGTGSEAYVNGIPLAIIGRGWMQGGGEPGLQGGR